MLIRLSTSCVTMLLVVAAPLSPAPTRGADPVENQAAVSFAREIRPLLSQNCFACHGPDAEAREADLRLDVALGADAQRGGHDVLAPYAPEESELVDRISSPDPDYRMPPPETGKQLTPQQQERIRQWIEQGAQYDQHWAFAPPVRPAIPPAANAGRLRVINPIDSFIVARLAAQGLTQSPAADRSTLIRRLSFDLRGIPPSPHEVRGFIADESPAAYDRLVSQLLASPHFGERLAAPWLDLVRYADSCGYHADLEWSVWPYRDYVVDAFNRNMPFDKFTREQLAGDLLPGATLEQRIAAGFNRLNMKSTEFGVQDAEYVAKYAADRVRTTATTWLGMTMGCAECHDHKFDPISTRDFYRFAAFFADIKHLGFYPDAQTNGWGETVRLPTPRIDAELAALKQSIVDLRAGLSKQSGATAARTFVPDARLGESVWNYTFTEPPSDWMTPDFADVDFSPGTAGFGRQGTPNAAIRTQWLRDDIWLRIAFVAKPPVERLYLQINHDEDAEVYLNGKLIAELEGYSARYVEIALTPDQISLLEDGENVLAIHCQQTVGGQYIDAGLTEYSVEHADPGVAATIAEREAKIKELEALRPTMLATVAVTPRVTRVLARGNWMDQSGEVVTPGVPSFAGSIDEPRRATRLDLAQWLTSAENPLTARVFVNRLWGLLFGTGLSKTVEDLGSQGEPPSHPYLLDHLALEFIRSGWDVKHIVRYIVTSATYRQSSAGWDDRDPTNRFLARQAKFRLDAEFVRDVSLAASGLLVKEVGGRSVKPYQPAGYWDNLFFPKRTYKHDIGAAQYRRGLYTHWQRQFLHPAMLMFDASTREECTARRPRSNTPLAALVMLNDPSRLEAARVLAAEVLRAGGKTVTERCDFVAQRVLSRPLQPAEHDVLQRLLKQNRQHYLALPQDATALGKVGLAVSAADLDPVELAAWTAVTRALLNTHEAITRM